MGGKISTKNLRYLEGVNALATFRMICYNDIDIFKIRKRNRLSERKIKRQGKLIAMNRRKLRKHTNDDKNYESLQAKVSMPNSRLNRLILLFSKSLKV